MEALAFLWGLVVASDGILLFYLVPFVALVGSLVWFVATRVRAKLDTGYAPKDYGTVTDTEGSYYNGFSGEYPDDYISYRQGELTMTNPHLPGITCNYTYGILLVLSYGAKMLFVAALVALVGLTGGGIYYAFYPEACPFTDVRLVLFSIAWCLLTFESYHIYGLALWLETRAFRAWKPSDLG